MGGHAFQARRALNLAALTARLKPCPSTNVPIPRIFPQPVKPARNDKNKGLNGTLRLPLRLRSGLRQDRAGSKSCPSQNKGQIEFSAARKAVTDLERLSRR